jgi:hypothetical protein
MFEFTSTAGALQPHRIAVYAAGVILAGSLGGYAIHEHNAAKDLATKNQQSAAQLDETKHELLDLTSKVNTLVAREQEQAQIAAPAAANHAGTPARPSAAHVRREDPRYKKLQAQLDAQGKAIEDTRSALASTQGDLANTRTELTGSIAHTHDELVVLERKGERNYTEFDISKSKEFQRKGPLSVRLRKANEKHQYADMDLIVDDRTVTQKHINLYQPVLFSTPDSPQPVEIVINQIDKNHIHGYVAAPKYKKSDLASMPGSPDAASPDQASSEANRKPLPLPQ